MQHMRWLGLSIVSSWLLIEHAASAQSLAEQATMMRLLNNQQLITEILPTATAAKPSDQNFTVPSLWWQQQQQGEAINSRLIDNWQAYNATVSSTPHVDIIVNGQIWPLLNYLEQYAFITQFGESAKSYGYQSRIFTGNRLVGLYVCDFSHETGSQPDDLLRTPVRPTNLPNCIVELDYLGQGSIRGGRQR